MFTMSCSINISVTTGAHSAMFSKKIAFNIDISCSFFVKGFKRLYIITLSRSEVVPPGVYSAITLLLAVAVLHNTKQGVKLHGPIPANLG